MKPLPVISKGFRAVERGMRGGALVLAVFVGLAGCAIQHAPDMTPEALRAAIRAGDIVQPGERVSVVTTEAGERDVFVVAVDADHIRATPVRRQQQGELSVPIDEIVSVRKGLADKKAVKYIGGATGLYLSFALLIFLFWSFL